MFVQHPDSPFKFVLDKSNNVLKQRASQIKLINSMEHQKEEEESQFLLPNQDGRLNLTRRRSSANIQNDSDSEDRESSDVI